MRIHFERLYKGKVRSDRWGLMTTICEGPYWDWPAWKRCLATVAHRPYARVISLMCWWGRRKPSRCPQASHYDYGDDGSKCYHPSAREYRQLGYALASSRIKPVFYRVVFPEEPATGAAASADPDGNKSTEGRTT